MTINTQKLRDLVTFDFELPVSVRDAVDDACDHIDAQTAEISQLRKALKDLMVASPSQLACEAFYRNPSDRHADADVCQPVERYQDALEAARAALQEKSNG